MVVSVGVVVASKSSNCRLLERHGDDGLVVKRVRCAPSSSESTHSTLRVIRYSTHSTPINQSKLYPVYLPDVSWGNTFGATLQPSDSEFLRSSVLVRAKPV